VDDSSYNTLKVAEEFGIKHFIRHYNNRKYGTNQKTCYKKVLELKGYTIIILHPDYKYTHKLIHSMSYLKANDVYKMVLGSRMLGKGALKGGKPLCKYIFNRILTVSQKLRAKSIKV
jgi:hypothetical protein